jgi:hypothetical protein
MDTIKKGLMEVRGYESVANMYVDLSGYIEETSIYNDFHYFISAVTAEVKQVTEKGLRILQCKMVYKRKYHIGEDVGFPISLDQKFFCFPDFRC